MGFLESLLKNLGSQSCDNSSPIVSYYILKDLFKFVAKALKGPISGELVRSRNIIYGKVAYNFVSIQTLFKSDFVFPYIHIWFWD